MSLAEIGGFSSSDEESNTVGLRSAKNLVAKQSSAKRTLTPKSRNTNTQKLKRHKKCYEGRNTTLLQFPKNTSGCFNPSMPYVDLPCNPLSSYRTQIACSGCNKRSKSYVKSTVLLSNSLGNSSKVAESSLPSDSSPELDKMRLDITWSDNDSDNENSSSIVGKNRDVVILQTPDLIAEKGKYGISNSQSPDLFDRKRFFVSAESKQADIIDDPSPGSVSTEDNIPLNISSIKKEDERVFKSQESSRIDDYGSDSESCMMQLDTKVSCLSISPNTPSPTFSCTLLEEWNSHPPLDSTKKDRKSKYRRDGLAERLHQIKLEDTAHRTQLTGHICEEVFLPVPDSTSDPAEDNSTMTVRVISESLDHHVYILVCHVISQDCEPILPKHVIVIMDCSRRKTLDLKITSDYLRIYSPWKLFKFPHFTEPLVACVTHCEVISSSCFDLFLDDISDSSYNQPRQEKMNDTSYEYSIENSSDQTGEEREECVVNWPYSTFECLETSVKRFNVTAMIQRIYWRNTEILDLHLDSACLLTSSIIEHAKILNKETRMSLCCLVQNTTDVCCEVRISEDILLNGANTRSSILCQAEGNVLSFCKLQLIDHRNRKQEHQLFSVIDSLKISNSEKQESCYVFTLDDQSTVEHANEDEVFGYPEYSAPERLHHLNPMALKPHRVSLYGKLLYARFTEHDHYSTKNFRLWFSAVINSSTGFALSDIIPELTVPIFQVYFTSGRTFEWTESTLSPGQQLFLQDLLLDKENPSVLNADLFSKFQVILPHSSRADSEEPGAWDIHEVWRRSMSKIMNDEKFTYLNSFPVAGLPTLDKTYSVHSLASFEGIICGIDYENAFFFYTCLNCRSEDISEISDGSRYHCNACKMKFHVPVTLIHLEVYMRSMETPTVEVKVKLLERTVRALLCGSENIDTRETFDVKSVLNKHVGPIYCYITDKMDKSSKINFKLEEIDSSCWNPI